MKDIENKITEFANTFNYLNDMAYTHYKPSVDMYITQLKSGENVSENELCLFDEIQTQKHLLINYEK